MPIRMIGSSGLVHWKKGEMDAALLATAADLEAILFIKLLFEGKKKEKEMQNWPLGKYITEALKAKLIPAELARPLREFCQLRNLIIHNHGMLSKIKASPTRLYSFKKWLLAICIISKNLQAKYDDDQELEHEYGKYFDRCDQLLKKLL